MSTGEIHTFYKGSAQTNGSVVVTAGGVAFWGDLSRRFFALDATSGKVLWQTTVGRSGLGQHHHLFGERQTVRGGDDGRRIDDVGSAGIDSRPEAAQERERGLRIRAAGAEIAWRPSGIFFFQSIFRSVPRPCART